VTQAAAEGRARRLRRLAPDGGDRRARMANAKGRAGTREALLELARRAFHYGLFDRGLRGPTRFVASARTARCRRTGESGLRSSRRIGVPGCSSSLASQVVTRRTRTSEPARAPSSASTSMRRALTAGR
jgi:hypothetical protein